MAFSAPPSFVKTSGSFVIALLACGILVNTRGFTCKPAPFTAYNAQQTSSGRLAKIGIALLEYVSDNDNRLPPMTTSTRFESALQPYFRGDSLADKLYFQPGTGKRFVVNDLLSASKLKPGAAWIVLLYEAVPAKDGSRITLLGQMVTPKADEANPPPFLDPKVKRLSKRKFQLLLSAKIDQLAH